MKKVFMKSLASLLVSVMLLGASAIGRYEGQEIKQTELLKNPFIVEAAAESYNAAQEQTPSFNFDTIGSVTCGTTQTECFDADELCKCVSNVFTKILSFFKYLFFSRITFDTDGGSEIEDIYGLKLIQEVIPPANPTKEGYTFVGWDKDIPAKMPCKDITIKALWSKLDYSVTFNTNGGSELSKMTAQSGSSVTLPTPAKSYSVTFDANGGSVNTSSYTSDSTFSGWFTDESLAGQSYAAGESYVLMSDTTMYAKWTDNALNLSGITPSRIAHRFVGWFTSPSGGQQCIEETIVSSNLVLYAHWEQYALYFDVNGGSGGPATQYGYGDTLIPNEVPEKTNFKFLGWSTSSNSDIVSYTPGNTINISSQSGTTLYAVWDYEYVYVPDLIGLTRSQAEAKLIEVGLSVGEIKYKNSFTYAEGLVIDQTYAVNSKVEKGTAVGFTCSLGSEITVV